MALKTRMRRVSMTELPPPEVAGAGAGRLLAADGDGAAEKSGVAGVSSCGAVGCPVRSMAGAPNVPASVSLGAEGTSPGVEKSKGMRPEGVPEAIRPEPEADS